MLRYTQALITQTAQTATCNRHHTVHLQFCRWLLLSSDRTQGTELIMTHSEIGTLLGVRREGVTEAAQKLKRRAVIQCKRGRINVLSRARLEGCACECYGIVKNEYERLLTGELAA